MASFKSTLVRLLVAKEKKEVPITPPTGYVFLLGQDNQLLVGADGQYILGVDTSLANA